jgi:hypothetical protein
MRRALRRQARPASGPGSPTSRYTPNLHRRALRKRSTCIRLHPSCTAKAQGPRCLARSFPATATATAAFLFGRCLLALLNELDRRVGHRVTPRVELSIVLKPAGPSREEEAVTGGGAGRGRECDERRSKQESKSCGRKGVDWVPSGLWQVSRNGTHHARLSFSSCSISSIRSGMAPTFLVSAMVSRRPLVASSCCSGISSRRSFTMACSCLSGCRIGLVVDIEAVEDEGTRGTVGRVAAGYRVSKSTDVTSAAARLRTLRCAASCHAMPRTCAP